MKHKIVLGIVTFFLALGAIVLGTQGSAGQNIEPQRIEGDRPCAQWPQSRSWEHRPHRRGNPHWDEMPYGRGNPNVGDMQVVHQLFTNHDAIQRTVEEVPGGIRAVTESDDPQIAALIQEHVTEMYARIDEGRPFTMMSPTLPDMFVHADRYDRQLELTPNGVAITETSEDPEIVALIREHGQEVNEFVEDGMLSMMEAGRCPAWEQ